MGLKSERKPDVGDLVIVKFDYYNKPLICLIIGKNTSVFAFLIENEEFIKCFFLPINNNILKDFSVDSKFLNKRVWRSDIYSKIEVLKTRCDKCYPL